MNNSTQLTVAGAAEYLGCSLNYVYQLLRMRRLEGATRSGKIWLIPKSALDAYRNRK